MTGRSESSSPSKGRMVTVALSPKLRQLTCSASLILSMEAQPCSTWRFLASKTKVMRSTTRAIQTTTIQNQAKNMARIGIITRWSKLPPMRSLKRIVQVKSVTVAIRKSRCHSLLSSAETTSWLAHWTPLRVRTTRKCRHAQTSKVWRSTLTVQIKTLLTKQNISKRTSTDKI